jgi:hypothetical protein
MKTMSLRALSREAPSLDEIVLVLHDSEVIGRFIPLGLENASRDPAPVSGSFGAPRPAPKPGRKK